MVSVDEHACHSGPIGFQNEQVAYAGFVGAGLVVHDNDITGIGGINRFEDHVDTAGVHYGHGRPRDTGCVTYRGELAGGCTHRDVEAHAGVSDVWGG